MMPSYTLPCTVALISTLFVSPSSAQYPKRGLGANEDVQIWQFGGSWEGAPSQVNWQYNWDSTTSKKNSFCEYVPMLCKSCFQSHVSSSPLTVFLNVQRKLTKLICRGNWQRPYKPLVFRCLLLAYQWGIWSLVRLQ